MSETHTKVCTPTIRSSPFIVPDTSTRRSSPSISPNTHTNRAQRACLIFSMRSAAIGPPNSATARRWHLTCSRKNSFAKLSEPGAYHEHSTHHFPHLQDSECDGDRYRACAHSLSLKRAGEPDDILLRKCRQVRGPGALQYSRGPDAARAGRHDSANYVEAHASAYGCGGVQRVQHYAGDYSSRRTCQQNPGSARAACQSRRTNARREQPRFLTTPGLLFEGGRFLPPGGEILRPCAGPISTPCHRRTRSRAGRVGP